MNKFIERIKPDTSTKIIKSCIPNVLINPIALAKMQLLVDICTEEVGWLGIAIKRDNSFIIQDIYIFEQEVASTTTEITPEGLTKFAEHILTLPDGIDIWNNLKVWGHSHVNMSVFSSSQDDEQMNFFSNNGHDWFIRIIANKEGDLKVDIYNYEAGISYVDVPWECLISPEEEDILNKINMLYVELEEKKKTYINNNKEFIKKEIEEKVKKKYCFKSNHNYRDNFDEFNIYNYNHPFRTMYNDDEDDNIYPYTKKNEIEKEEDVKINYITNYNDVFLYFDEDDLNVIADECLTTKSLETLLLNTYYIDFFTEHDLEKILKYAKQYKQNYILKEVTK